MVTLQKLLFYIEKKYNVLMIGAHGVGKTTIIKEAFEKAGLKWAYFSGSTMDPWVDFIGVPTKVGIGDGEYLNFIRPKHLATGDIQAIFVDEYNRSPKKIRNAIMELIQFKTINGVPFSKDLRVVWAAVNPDNDENENGVYDTERLDPAQKDRFHVHLELPYKCDLKYFTKTYGEDYAKASIDWWNALPDKQKLLVSPRRLDYALKLFSDEGDIRDVLPASTNPSMLISAISIGPIEKKLTELYSSKDIEETKKFLLNENSYSFAISHILKNKDWTGYFLPNVSSEKLSNLFITDGKVKKHIIDNIRAEKEKSLYVEPLSEIAIANQNHAIAFGIRTELEKAGVAVAPKSIDFFDTNDFNKKVGTILQSTLKTSPPVSLDVSKFEANLIELYDKKSTLYLSSNDRYKIYKVLKENIDRNMSAKSADAVLKICGLLTKSTRRIIETKFTLLNSIVNSAISALIKSGEFTSDTEKRINNLMKLKRWRQTSFAPSVVDIRNYLKNEKA